MRLQHFLHTTLGKPAVASSCVGNRLIARTFSVIMILNVKAGLEAVAQLNVQQAKLNFNFKPRPEGHLQLVDKTQPAIRLNVTSRLNLTSINTSHDANVQPVNKPQPEVKTNNQVKAQPEVRAQPNLRSWF
jgi:hypothetical protein